jgi:hypothetical protein
VVAGVVCLAHHHLLTWPASQGVSPSTRPPGPVSDANLCHTVIRATTIGSLRFRPNEPLEKESEPHMLEAGTEAPDFTVDDQDGNPVTLSSHRGRWVLLWWYPKAGTPG